MATLRNDLDILLALQKIDTECARARKARASLDGGAALANQAQTAALEAEKARATQHQKNGALKDAELEQAGVERKLKDYEGRLQKGMMTNPREIANVEKEIAQLTRQRGALDDKILTLMDETEAQQRVVAQAEKRAQTLEQEAASQLKKAQAEAARLDALARDLDAQRPIVAAQVGDAALLKRYEMIRARPASGGLAIARVDGSSCGACHMQIGTQDAYHAQEADKMVICENCGRIMG